VALYVRQSTVELNEVVRPFKISSRSLFGSSVTVDGALLTLVLVAVALVFDASSACSVEYSVLGLSISALTAVLFGVLGCGVVTVLLVGSLLVSFAVTAVTDWRY
jgi:hypothetical protein